MYEVHIARILLLLVDLLRVYTKVARCANLPEFYLDYIKYRIHLKCPTGYYKGLN